MENRTVLKSLLSVPKDIVIVTHRNPDGDAVGSSMGLSHYLQSLGHNTKVIAPSDYPDFLSWIPQIEHMLVYDTDPEMVKNAVERAGLIFCLDFNSLDRIDKVGELVAASKAPKVMIDHHLFPEPFADYVLSDTTASSTCEMVYDFIMDMGDTGLLRPLVGDCLFTGIVTDTGSFRYSTSPKLYRIVADLVERGVDDYRLQDLIHNNMTEKQIGRAHV